VAVTAILIMYRSLRVHLAHHKPLAKLGAFKLVVFLGFIQGIVFEILLATHTIKPTSKLTYADVKVGIPTLLTCVEMVPISLFFHYAYSYREYSLDHQRVPGWESQVVPRPQATSYQGGFLGWRAVLSAADPREALFGFWFAFKMAAELKERSVTGEKNGSMGMPPPAGSIWAERT
jgi:Organic solute transporter Ostalpha